MRTSTTSPYLSLQPSVAWRWLAPWVVLFCALWLGAGLAPVAEPEVSPHTEVASLVCAKADMSESVLDVHGDPLERDVALAVHFPLPNGFLQVPPRASVALGPPVFLPPPQRPPRLSA